MRPVSYLRGERLRGWFDIARTPVAPAEKHNGLSESVASVHEMLKKAEAGGMPANRIVLAGFSQGAVMALAAGLTYEHPIAGICAFSGWLPAGVLEKARHKETPIFMGHGERDSLIPVKTGLRSAWALKNAGYSNLQFQRYGDLAHKFGADGQLKDLKTFIMTRLTSQKATSQKPVVSPDKPAFSPDATSTNADKPALSPDATSTNSGSDSSDDDSSEDLSSRSRTNSMESSSSARQGPASATSPTVVRQSSCLMSRSSTVRASMGDMPKSSPRPSPSFGPPRSKLPAASSVKALTACAPQPSARRAPVSVSAPLAGTAAPVRNALMNARPGAAPDATKAPLAAAPRQGGHAMRPPMQHVAMIAPRGPMVGAAAMASPRSPMLGARNPSNPHRVSL